MREGRCEGESIQHLGNSCLLDITLLVLAPVACSQSTPKTSSDGVRLDGVSEVNLPLAHVELILDVLLHVLYDLAELLSEQVAQKGPSHVHALFAIVVAIILLSSPEGALNQTVYHVAHEVGLFHVALCLSRDVREQVCLEYLQSPLDTVPLVVAGCSTTPGYVVQSSILSHHAHGLLKGGAEGLTHVLVVRVIHYFVQDLFVRIAAECPHKDGHRDRVPDF